MAQKIQRLEEEELDDLNNEIHGDYEKNNGRNDLEAADSEYDETPREHPSSYLNLINDTSYPYSVKKKTHHYSALSGLISMPQTPIHLFYKNKNNINNLDIDDSQIDKMHRSFIKFSKQLNLEEVNISKREFKRTNRNLVDNSTMDNYYELIRERELGLIDELNLKYANIKLDI